MAATSSPAPTAPPTLGGSLQVTDTPFAGSLVDTIVGDVAGAYFGF
ncbi:MAG: hypothetical protein ABI598_02495 [Chloroflexota bacterium]